MTAMTSSHCCALFVQGRMRPPSPNGLAIRLVTIKTDQWRVLAIVGNVYDAVEECSTAVSLSPRCQLQAVCG